MNNKNIKRYSLSKQVADQLEEMIANGKYAIGEKIPTEVELIEIFQVSRNTVREAVQSLASAGVLDVRQGDGTYVRSSNRFDANMNMKFSQVSLADITEARNALEVSLVVLAAKCRTEEDMKNITSAFLERRNLKDSVKENTMADIQFHMAIADGSHNRILIDLYRSIFSYLESVIEEKHIDAGMDMAQIDMLHEKLYQAILRKDPESAKICTRNILKI